MYFSRSDFTHPDGYIKIYVLSTKIVHPLIIWILKHIERGYNVSEHLEKIADFKILDFETREGLSTVSTPNEMPFGKLMNLDFIFMNIKSGVKYHIEVLIDGSLLSITTVNIPDEHLMYKTSIDGVEYGKTQGDFNFNLAIRDYGVFKLECVLYEGKTEKDRMKKYYSFEDYV